MVMTKASRGRLRRSLPAQLRRGWERAVFASPEGGDARSEQVIEGPGPAAEGAVIDEVVIGELLLAAEAAAEEGLVKQTVVVDARRRLSYDARHGHLKVRTLDEARAKKAMGGKERSLRPDTSAALLRAIGIMNADGTISTRHARKYKQICHLAELCRPTWERAASQRTIDAAAPLRILDLACGNAYLSFILAESLRLAAIPHRIHGVDVREDVIARSRARAAELGDPGLTFSRATIAAANEASAEALGAPPEIVVALHACDTATDQALELAIRAGAPAILCVPCCQHELAAQLAAGPAEAAPLPAIRAHGLLRGAYADVLTDSIRCEALAACGYQVDVVEFVDSEHSAKNLLIRAHRRHPGAAVDPRRWRLDALRARCAALGVDPCLLRLLSSDMSEET